MAEEFMEGLTNIFDEDIGNLADNPFQHGNINASIETRLGDEGISFDNKKRY